MKEFTAVNKVCEISHPLDWTPDKEQLFVDACREMATFHASHNRVIRKLYESENFDPNSLQKPSDLERLPHIGVTAMKKHLLLSRDPSAMTLKLTSSGTRGLKTQIWFDEESLARVQRMLDVLLDQEGLISDKATNYFVFGYNPKQSGDLGIAFSSQNQLRFAPVNNAAYALNKNAEGNWEFDKHRALETLLEYSKAPEPVRLLGMPSFLFEFTEFARQQGVSFSFGKESLVLTGGGWKAAEDKQITREQFRALCFEMYGIPEDRFRDGFGMAEHSAPYFECKHHRFHVPVYNRLIVRDPHTLEPSPRGVKGLMQLITPFNSMMPNLSILATDWVSLDPEPCTCGHNAPTFQLHGRAGLSKHKGCALQANDIVKRVRK